MSNKTVPFLATLSLLLLLTPLFSAHAASPYGRFGWWVLVSDIVGDDASCGVGMVKQELYLMDASTGLPVSGVGSAILVSGNVSDGSVTNEITGTSSILGTVCYNPDTQFIGVDVDGGAGYRNFHAAGSWNNAATVPRGKLMRTTVWLTPSSASAYEYVQNSPVNKTVNVSPSYTLNLNSFPTIYGATSAKSALLFIQERYTRALVANPSVSLSGGVGTKTIPAQTIPDGVYIWEFYLGLNANHDTGGGFSISNVPVSGLGTYNWPFTLDTKAPTFNATTGYSPATPAYFDTVTITGSVSDVTAGVNTINVYVDGTVMKTCNYIAAHNADCVATVGPYTASTTHSYVITATDAAGNTATSTSANFSIQKLPDLRSLTSDARAPTYNNPVSVTFGGAIRNWGGVTAPTENVWADIEIDWECTATRTADIRLNAGGPWTSLPSNSFTWVSTTLMAADSALHNGTGCYRVIADRDNLVTESNDTNNIADWYTFYINNLPQCSDGIDNDGDTQIDFPADSGCSSDADTNETDDVLNVASGPVTLNSGTLTKNQSVTFKADVINTGTVNTGAFTDNFTYQWNGGTWNNLGVNIVEADLAGSGGQRTDTSESLTLLDSGTLVVQHCVDSSPETLLNESNEGDNCTTQSFTVSANPPCPAMTDGSCDLPETVFGGSVVKACTSAAGSCNYTCGNAATWIKNENSCLQPIIDMFKVCDQGGTGCVNAGFKKYVDPGAPLELTWSSQNTTSCSAVLGDGFSTNGSTPTTAGTDAIDASLTPDSTDEYKIACQYEGGVAVQSSTIVVTNVVVPVLTATQRMVKPGDQVVLSWDTNNGNENACSLTGGNLGTSFSPIPLVDDVELGSSASITILGRTTFVLTCGALSGVFTVEITPTGGEM